jgi:hypothetical protein
MTVLDRYLEDIDRATKAQARFCALALALALPDICGSIEYPDEHSPGKRYRDWFDAWCGFHQSLMTAQDCWALRCAYLHSGQDEFSGPVADYAALGRIHFTHGTADGVWVSRFLPVPEPAKPGVLIPVEDFCRDMISSAIAWEKAAQRDARKTDALGKLMEIRPAA